MTFKNVDTPTCFVKGYSARMEKKIPNESWSEFVGQPIRALDGGLINGTWQVGNPPVGVLQSLSPIFSPEVNLDIDTITRHLVNEGLTTPVLLQTTSGKLWHQDDQGTCWRALSWIRGVTHHRIPDPTVAHEAGRLVAQWHQALSGVEHSFAFSRPGAHDTKAHMDFLLQAIDADPDHRLRSQVMPVAEEILERWRAWEGLLDGPLMLAHGDLKISNLRFAEDGKGLALLDLDTMAYLSRDVEMGDAWRSWCNTSAEDSETSDFSLPLFEASAAGYLSVSPLSAEDRLALPLGVERICLELAARFAADALHESYFGWSSTIAPTRGEHNLIRAKGQLSLARSVRSNLLALETILKRV